LSPLNKRGRKKGRNDQTLLEGRLKYMITTWNSKLRHVRWKSSSKYVKLEASFSIKSVGESQAHIFVKLHSSFKIQCQYILGGLGNFDTWNN
jgi:hypothetical protein